jgi:hypothetical protein
LFYTSARGPSSAESSTAIATRPPTDLNESVE